jgi:virginiamycin B lyase
LICEVTTYPLPPSAPEANLNTAAFDGDGVLWFTGQAGWYGSLDPSTGEVAAFPAPRGIGPYGITATPDGEIYFSSLAGSYLGAVDRSTGEVRVLDPPTADAGLRRAWADSEGRIWVYVDETDAVWLSDFGANAIIRFDPEAETFTSFAAERQPAEVRQLLGRPGEVWGAESAADRLVVVRTLP